MADGTTLPEDGHFDDSATVRLRRKLMAAIVSEIRSRGWSQARAARVVGITAPRMSDLARGKLEKFSADALVSIGETLGIGVEVVAAQAQLHGDQGAETARRGRSTARYFKQRGRRRNDVVANDAIVPVAERPGIIRAGLLAAGTPAAVAERFVGPSSDIVHFESAWNSAACTTHPEFMGGPPSGLTQLTPRLFEAHHVEGTPNDVFDPVASVAALWCFIANNFAVDLISGAGVEEFHEFWKNHRLDWREHAAKT